MPTEKKPKTQTEIFEDEKKDTFLGQVDEDDEGIEVQDDEDE